MVSLSQPAISWETFVTGCEFSTYVEAVFGLRWRHVLHCVMFCNALQHIQYQIVYREQRQTAATDPMRHIVFDNNFWKSFVHARWDVPTGDQGCLTLCRDAPSQDGIKRGQNKTRRPR